MNSAPTNVERAQRITDLTAGHQIYSKDALGDPEITLLYLLTDLRHFAHRHGFDFDKLSEDARGNFADELAEEDEDGAQEATDSENA